MAKCPSLAIHANFLETLQHNHFFGLKNRAKTDPRIAQKHKTSQFSHVWAGCQLPTGIPNFAPTPHVFLTCFLCFSKNIFFVRDYETLS